MGLLRWLESLMGKRETTLFSGNSLTNQLETEAAMVEEMQAKTAAKQRAMEPAKPATEERKRVVNATRKLEKAEGPDYFDASDALWVDPAKLPPEVLEQIRDGATTDEIKNYLDNLKRAESRRR